MKTNEEIVKKVNEDIASGKIKLESFDFSFIVQALIIIFIFILIMVLVILLIREIVLWYYRINEQIDLMKENNRLLNELIDIEYEKIHNKSIDNGEKQDTGE